MKQNLLSKIIKILAALAALLYSSWILGYFMNLHVALYGTASELAVNSQPFAWMFRYGDVVSGSLIIVVAILLLVLRKRKPSLAPYLYLSFGVFTILAACFSLLCSPAAQHCGEGAVLSRVFIHTTFGLLAGISLFMAIIIETQNKKQHSQLITYTSILWVMLGLVSVFIGFFTDVPAYQATLQRFYLFGTTVFIYLLPRLLLPADKGY